MSLKMEYGNKLNPERSLRMPEGIKETRQKVIIIYNILYHSQSQRD